MSSKKKSIQVNHWLIKLLIGLPPHLPTKKTPCRTRRHATLWPCRTATFGPPGPGILPLARLLLLDALSFPEFSTKI